MRTEPDEFSYAYILPEERKKGGVFRVSSFHRLSCESLQNCLKWHPETHYCGSVLKPPHLRRTVLLLALLTVSGILIAGYHPGAEDDGVYLAAIHHDLNPALFRMDSDFFTLQLQATIYDKLMAASVLLVHLPVAVVVLLWHVLAIFGILAGCYRIAARCFLHNYARWCG